VTVADDDRGANGVGQHFQLCGQSRLGAAQRIAGSGEAAGAGNPGERAKMIVGELHANFGSGFRYLLYKFFLGNNRNIVI
jgi:hypothetical protein